MEWALKQRNAGKNHDFPQIIAILISCIAGISNGLLFSWTSPTIPKLVADGLRNISLEAASYFTVISPIAMIVSAPLISFVLETLGPRVSVLLIAVPQLLAWITILLAGNIWIFYVNRVISGVADAAYFGVVAVYVCEVAEPRVRGIWGNAVAISVYFGTFLINIIGSYKSVETTALICSSVPIVHVSLFWFMPESPYYLLTKGKDDKARESLRILRWNSDVEEEMISLKADVKRQISERGTMKDLFISDTNRKALLICILIRLAQQLAGLPAFETYTQYMFQQAGGNISEKVSSIVFTGILFACVVLSAYVVELVGRRPLMIVSCLGCGMILGVLTSYFYIKEHTNLNVSNFTWVPLTGMSIFIVICSPGIGIVPTLMLGELFSSSIKAKAVSVMNVVLAVTFLIVPKLFQSLTHNFGIYAPFLFFTSTCFVFGILSYFYVVETKGKTLEEIQQELKGNKIRNK